MRVRVLAIAAGLAVAGCNGPVTVGSLNPDAPGPTRSTGAPFGVDQGEVETPNSLPAGDTTRDPMAPSNGVIGVLHMPSSF